MRWLPAVSMLCLGSFFAEACSDPNSAKAGGTGASSSTGDTSSTSPGSAASGTTGSATPPSSTRSAPPASTGLDGSDSTTDGDTTAAGESSSGSTGSTASLCESGTLPSAWPDGTSCGDETSFVVHRYSDNTFILRQSLCTGFEAPFLYLLFGEDRVLLEDTGYNGAPAASAVGQVVDAWLAEQGKASIELVVVNSHAHGDHTGGNGQFQGQPGTTVVGTSVGAVSDFFGIDNWPGDVGSIDLGNREIEVIPLPGHQSSHIALFDANEGLLLTGDTLYPGRLYIADFPTYVQSIGVVADRFEAEQICHVFGTHIEMTQSAGVDFEFGADEHPNERALDLGWEHVLELRDALDAMGAPQLEVHDDFIIYPL